MKWAAAAVVVSLIMAGIGVLQFVMDPLKARIDVARDNLRVELGRLEHRLDNQDERIRALERDAR